MQRQHWMKNACLGLLALGLATGAQAQEPGAGAGAGTNPMPMGMGTPPPPGGVVYNPPAPIRSGQPISVMVFPFVNNAMTGGPALAQYLQNSVKGHFFGSNQYQVTTYSPQASLVRRAVQDGLLAREDLLALQDATTGEVNLERARLIAERLGVQAVLVGTIEDVAATAGMPQANATVSLQVVGSTQGNQLKGAAVTGMGTGVANQSPDELAELAVADAARKAVTEMGVQTAPTNVETTGPGGTSANGTRPANGQQATNTRKNRGLRLRVPPWLGVALFTTGVFSAIK